MSLNKDNATKETDKVTICETRTHSLRERWDTDFALFTLDPAKYNISTTEGEWMKAVVNAAVTDGNRMIDLLSYADERLRIAFTDEKQKERKDLAGTEHAALGLLHLADMVNEDDPEAATIRGQGSAFAVLRGWTAYRLLLTEDEEDERKVFPDLKAWDARNTYWIYGNKRMLWVCYVRYSNPAEVHEEYPDWKGYVSSKDTVATGGGENLIEVHNIFDCSEKDKPAEEGVAINGEWVKTPEVVKVGGIPLLYIPVRIKAGRSLPLIKGGITTQTDNIKFVGESFLANTREILPLESRLFIYRMTRARDLAQSANIVEYNSQLGDIPAGFEKAAIKGRTAYLDVGKGQKLAERMIPPQGNEIDLAMAQVGNMRVSGSGMGPVAYGLPPYPDTAQGTDIINHNILDAIKPFKQLIEQDRVWQAEEFIRQYKHGKFKGQEFEGYDYHGKRFKAKVKPSDIDDNWHFGCELVLDLVRDENLHVGMAIQEVKTGLLSKQTALDKHNLVADPDLEMKRIDQEQGREMFEMPAIENLMALIDDYIKDKSPEARFKLQSAWEILQRIRMQAQMQVQGNNGGGGGQNIPGQSRPMNPQAAAGAMNQTGQIPPQVVEAARRQFPALERGR